jgi:hypothetical protein
MVSRSHGVKPYFVVTAAQSSGLRPSRAVDTIGAIILPSRPISVMVPAPMWL